jgi:hypothetical protein
LFDFEKTAGGAEWIDSFARRARQAEAHDGPSWLGHADWRVEHLRFENRKIIATYDWDSLALRNETELAGLSAHGFTADWSLERVQRIPTADDIHAYVADYEETRGRPFSKLARQSLFAHCVDFIAYGARFTHSLDPKKNGTRHLAVPFENRRRQSFAPRHQLTSGAVYVRRSQT